VAIPGLPPVNMFFTVGYEHVILRNGEGDFKIEFGEIWRASPFPRSRALQVHVFVLLTHDRLLSITS
jgi:hypothetical protein